MMEYTLHTNAEPRVQSGWLLRTPRRTVEDKHAGRPVVFQKVIVLVIRFCIRSTGFVAIDDMTVAATVNTTTLYCTCGLYCIVCTCNCGPYGLQNAEPAPRTPATASADTRLRRDRLQRNRQIGAISPMEPQPNEEHGSRLTAEFSSALRTGRT